MPGKKIKKVDGIGQKLLDQAIEDFMRHCRLKNLAEATMEYYQEDLEYFQRITQLKYSNSIKNGKCSQCCLLPLTKNIS